MTREEALQILDTIPTIGEQVDALEMAIKALENQPKFIIHSDGTIEQIIEPSIKDIYNKGWKDGAEAIAYHVELCEEENPTIPLSVIEDIKAEIDEQTEIHTDGEFYIKNIDVKRILDKHIADMRGTE